MPPHPKEGSPLAIRKFSREISFKRNFNFRSGGLEEIVADLLADRAPDRARSLLLEWEERRNASWVDAHRQAHAKAATGGHLPHMRGQLRHHLGERALVESAQAAQLGVTPFFSTPPGGVFTLARAGRFALVSITLAANKRLPRRSVSRRLLSRSNESIDPQGRLWDEAPRPDPTQLAFLGCLVAVPAAHDPMAPSELAFCVPSPSFDDWIVWTPLQRMHALLVERMDGMSPTKAVTEQIVDKAFAKFRLPKEGADEQGS